MRNKTATYVGMTIGALAGGFVPWLFGDRDLMGGWAIIGTLIGGVAGIWLGVVIGRKLG